MTVIDFTSEIGELIAQLRERDNDPAYADAPVLDAYARISRIQDTGDEVKTDRQLVDILREILRRGARLGEIFEDPKRSAWKKNGKRPAFVEVMERMKSRTVNGVICWHIDRLMRQPWDLETLIRMADAGYVIASCHGEYRLDSPDQLFTLRILVANACKESDDKSRRIRRDKVAQRNAGYARNGMAPFGHAVPAEQLERERDAIKWGVQTLLDGGSLGSVAREWNRRGLTSRRGVMWSPLNVRQTILLPRHAGMVATPGWTVHHGELIREMVDAETERIIDLPTFRTLCSIFVSRKRGRVSGESLSWLSGLLRCDTCGKPMVGSSVGGRTYEDGTPMRTYRCQPRGCVRRVAIDARMAERWAEREILRRLSAPENASRIARDRHALGEVQAQMNVVTDAIEDLYAKARRGDVSRYGFYAGQADLLETERLTPLRTEYERLSRLTDGSATLPSDIKRLRAELNDADPAKLRRLARGALPDGFYVAPCGRGRRLRGEEIWVRLSVGRGEAEIYAMD